MKIRCVTNCDIMSGVCLIVMMFLTWTDFGEAISLNPKRLRITTILMEPYVMKKPGAVDGAPGAYTGFIVDVLDHIGSLAGFNYTLHPAPDVQYGLLQEDGTWDGMMGQLVRKEVDMGAAAMFITETRDQAVSFTRPFLNVSATILLNKNSPAIFDIKHAGDLLQSPGLRIGMLYTGILIYEFRLTRNQAMKQLYDHIRNLGPGVLTKSNDEGVRRVRNDVNFAYIIPDVIGKYIAVHEPCDLVAVDKFLMNRHYALAVPRDSTLLPSLNRALENLQVTGHLESLRQKWWAGDCGVIRSSKYSSSLSAIATWPSALSLGLWPTIFLLLLM